MKAAKYLIACMTSMLPILAIAGDFYHVKDWGPMGCNEPKITAEINDAIKHPGSLSDNAFSRISSEGQCSPLSPNINLKLIRLETFTVPAGIQKVAYVLISMTNSPPDYFYVMQDDIEEITSRRKL